MLSDTNNEKEKKNKINESDIAIRVTNLSKCFQLYDTPRDRLKQFILPKIQTHTFQKTKQYYKEFWALKDVSFEIKKGETVGIIGRNGSGKSTLLQIICGTLHPSNGAVETKGRVAALLELGSGFNPEFTGRENIYMNAAVLGLTKQEIDYSYSNITSFADIGNHVNQPVKTYSSGMLMRLAFAVAINVKPDILIIDEALSVGDELFQRKCFAQIEAIKNNGSTILFVSHSASMINQLCDEAILLDHGNLLLRSIARKVTKYYHQLLFSSSDNEQGIIKNIKEDTVDQSKQTTNTTDDNESFSDFLDELDNIKPLKYQSNGGDITSFELQNINHEKVNIVSTGFNGIVKMKVQFHNSYEDVVFGFHLKSITGLEVAGLSHPPPNECLIKVNKDDFFEIYWKINITLTVGTYFFTYGVRSVENPDFIDRCVDGAIVKVVENGNSSAYGVFDISNKNSSWLTKIDTDSI